MELKKRKIPEKGEVWKHFTNKLYKIIAIAEHTETKKSSLYIEHCMVPMAYMQDRWRCSCLKLIWLSIQKQSKNLDLH